MSLMNPFTEFQNEGAVETLILVPGRGATLI